MKRRTRIDLGQRTSVAEDRVLDRKRQRWAERNKDKLDENPFLTAINPHQEHYGDPAETGDELQSRLDNLEFGNFPAYFKYRNKASTGNRNNTDHLEPPTGKSKLVDSSPISSPNPLDSGLRDERLECMKKEWFHGKNVLDIGCNRGHITYAIARLFSPKSIVGIDIDKKIVSMANKDLHLHLESGIIEESAKFRLERAAKLRLEGVSIYSEDRQHFPLSEYISEGPISVHNTQSQAATADPDSGLRIFPNNIVFVEHNYVPANDQLVAKQRDYFDTVVCLSVTKWIHLNYRDEGLKRFFKRIYKHLRPGGLLVLEAQPFDNYGRRKKLSDRLRANYYSIQFKPDEFDAYLLSEQIGFRQIIHESITEHECDGFKRPLKVFLK